MYNYKIRIKNDFLNYRIQPTATVVSKTIAYTHPHFPLKQNTFFQKL